MLLTLKPSSRNGIKALDERAARIAAPYSTYDRIPTTGSAFPDRSTTASTASASPLPSSVAEESSVVHSSPPVNHSMGTPHRNLPPPVPTTFATPERSLLTMNHMTVPVVPLPPPPSQWQNSDESMRQWLRTKAEEDKRKQEEEKTRQESLKLDQRKVEQNILRETLQAGVSPYMLPLVFAGLAGGDMQWAQQYISEMTSPPIQPYPQTSSTPQPPQQRPQLPRDTAKHHVEHPPTRPPHNRVHHSRSRSQQTAMEISPDNRMIPPNPYAAPPVHQISIPSIPPPTAQQQTPSSPSQNPYALYTPTVPTSSSALPFAPPVLSRLNTSEMHMHNASPIGNASTPASTTNTAHPSHFHQPQSASVKQDTPSSQQPQTSSISFHHWVPPSQSQSNTPSGKTPNCSPHSAHPSSHLRSEYQNSPKKRKSQASHQAVPPPPSHLSEVTTARQSPNRSHSNSLGGGNSKRGDNNLRPRSGSAPQNDNRESPNDSRSDSLKPYDQMHVSSLVRQPDANSGYSNSQEEFASQLPRGSRNAGAVQQQDENRPMDVAKSAENSRHGDNSSAVGESGLSRDAPRTTSTNANNGHLNSESSRSITPVSSETLEGNRHTLGPQPSMSSTYQ